MHRRVCADRSIGQMTGEATRTLRPFQEEGLRLANDPVVRSNAWRAAQVKMHRRVYRTTRHGAQGTCEIPGCLTELAVGEISGKREAPHVHVLGAQRRGWGSTLWLRISNSKRLQRRFVSSAGTSRTAYSRYVLTSNRKRDPA